MNKDDYDIEMEKIISVQFAKTRKLKSDYAHSNSSVVLGDIVTDHIGSIRVDDVEVATMSWEAEYPELIYKGVRVTKSGKDFKSGERRQVWQSNLETN